MGGSEISVQGGVFRRPGRPRAHREPPSRLNLFPAIGAPRSRGPFVAPMPRPDRFRRPPGANVLPSKTFARSTPKRSDVPRRSKHREARSLVSEQEPPPFSLSVQPRDLPPYPFPDNKISRAAVATPLSALRDSEQLQPSFSHALSADVTIGVNNIFFVRGPHLNSRGRLHTHNTDIHSGNGSGSGSGTGSGSR